MAQECVDGSGASRRVRSGWLDGRFEAPVLAVRGSGNNPAAECFNLLRSQFFVGIRRGHHLVGVFGQDPLNDGTLVGRSRFDGLNPVFHRVSSLGGVEAEICLPLFGVEPVTGKAVVREDRPDVAVEIDGLVGGGTRSGLAGRGDEQKGCEGGEVHAGIHSIRRECVFHVYPQDG